MRADAMEEKEVTRCRTNQRRKEGKEECNKTKMGCVEGMWW
jgi:hypothetical protein